jgi:hypothetical protein
MAFHELGVFETCNTWVPLSACLSPKYRPSKTLNEPRMGDDLCSP